MPLTDRDRRLFKRVKRLNGYLLLIAAGVFVYLLTAHRIETGVLAVTLCGVLWLSQRLLSFVTALDREQQRLLKALVSSAGVHAVHHSLRPGYVQSPSSLGLGPAHRRFLGAGRRLQYYVLLIAAAIFVSLSILQQAEFREIKLTVLCLSLCGIFWLTQRLLSLTDSLNEELARLSQAVQPAARFES